MRVQKQQALVNQQLWQDWQLFWQSPLGQEVLAAETRLLQPLLEEARGYHLLVLGTAPATLQLPACGIAHAMEWRPHPGVAEKDTCLIADPAALPLPDESIDLVILQHSLEFYQRPHALLKEAARVTLAKGELVIIGFNPNSLWGLARLFPPFMQSQVFRIYRQSRPISQGKLADWLEFLDLKKESQQQLFHRLPCNSRRLLERYRSRDHRLDDRNWPLAGVYILRVKKRIGCPLRSRPLWKKTGWMPLQPVSSATRHCLKNKQE